MVNDELSFFIALTLCVIANTLIGAVKHEKIDDFNWTKLLRGAIRYLIIIAGIVCLCIAVQTYDPLAMKFADELIALEQLIAIGAFGKVLIQIKEYFEIVEHHID